MREALLRVGKGQTEPYDVQLINKILSMALDQGNEAMIKLIFGYIDGLPVARTELTGKDGKDLAPQDEATKKQVAELNRKFNEFLRNS